jgi:hypothetical protein
MTILTLDEYKDFYYKYERCIDQVAVPKNTLTESYLDIRYKKYLRKQEKKKEKEIKKHLEEKKPIEFKIDEQWEECKAEAFNRNPKAEEFWESLDFVEKGVIITEMWGDFKKLDPCHIIGKGRSSKLKYNPDNILIAPRIFHYYIDSFKNPLTKNHESITEEERNEIFKKIIGDEKWDKLNKEK